MMSQYYTIKQRYPGVILLFRVGDFYETFYEDAHLVSKELNIVLTSRDGAPLAGVPHHALDAYLSRLVRKGYKVAICEQLEDPKLAKGVIKRDVIRIVTPGTVLEDSVLPEKVNNFLMSLVEDGGNLGVAFVDISTGEFLTTQLEGSGIYEKLSTEIAHYKPSEVIIPHKLAENKKLHELLAQHNIFITEYPGSAFEYDKAYEKLIEHHKMHSVEHIECEHLKLAVSASGAILSYIEETQKTAVVYIDKLKTYFSAQHMILDSTTVRNLELVQNVRDGTIKNTLLEILDCTATPMGARMLRKWLLEPLIDRKEIIERQNGVEILVKDMILRKDLQEHLCRIKDIERIVARATYGSANARDLIGLKNSIIPVGEIKKILEKVSLAYSHAKQVSIRGFAEGDSEVNTKLKLHNIDLNEKSCQEELRLWSLLEFLQKDLDTLSDIVELISKAIMDEPPATLKEGGIIKQDYDSRLDLIKKEVEEGKEWLATLEARERKKTAIKSLKVGYNNIFGYYIEVSKSYLHLVPENYIRKQTLANAERFTTSELKEKESLIITADERMKSLEYEIFLDVRSSIAKQAKRIMGTAKGIAALDVLVAFAECAVNYNYTKPEITDTDIIKITDGRHPVVERSADMRFVPNDTLLNGKDNRMIVLTGPNMAGKSTYMRQIADIVLLAQVGSFVPAKHASVGIVDRIFTRVGAFDDIVRGQSTFMVEMIEVANILTNATSKSLILLDELGRGTSTFDGLSIAWAVAEYIHRKKTGAKTIFATHYHHLTELANLMPGVVNYNIAVKEEKNDIIFLRKVIPGGTNKSYGIQVALLAGMPKDLIERAKELLKKLESESMIDIAAETELRRRKPAPYRYTQLLFSRDMPKTEKSHAVVEELKTTDITKLTPLEALVKLNELKKKIAEEGK